MSFFQGRTAVVTGAASGIGLQLSRTLTQRGVRVCLADINEDAVQAAAAGLHGAETAVMDVTDASVVQSVVDEFADRQGRLDFLFNNAGIPAGGETHLLTVEDFNQAIDINIRGVVNGVTAAYPRMIRQQHGCIVNTASAAGLYPLPLGVPYSMTKHAVLGLSTSLRMEAESHGIRVCVLCPTAVETPLLDSQPDQDSAAEEAGRGLDIRRYLTRLAGPPIPVEGFVKYALDSVEANRGVIVAPFRARFIRQLHRLLPAIVEAGTRRALRLEREAAAAESGTGR